MLNDSVLHLEDSGILEFKGSTDETYDFKISEEKLDIRVQFKDGKPTPSMVKINETKTAVFDILCLHRFVIQYLIIINQ